MRNALASLIAAVCLLAGAARAQNPLLELLTDKAQSPSYLADPGDGRLFIVELGGRVRILLPNGHLQDPNDAFLDVHGSVDTSGEGGMHSIAFDPDFATNRYVFVEYTRTGSGGAPLETVIARYTVMAADPSHVDPASAHIVITQMSPVGGQFANHKGGQLQFGPDGFLYFAWGDGGSQDNPSCGAQEHDTLLGKMIRIDPDSDDFPADPNRNYAIPTTNPFVGVANSFLPETWAVGFRNPYRFSFDRVTGDLWIGDVGGSLREELDMQSHSSTGGQNYGWKVLEGNQCRFQDPGQAGCESYVKKCDDPGYTAPLVDFDHSAGGTIIGGYVYRGATQTWRGRYIFADYIRSEIDVLTDDNGTPGRTVLVSDDTLSPTSLGEDHNGELYVMSTADTKVFRLRFDLLGHTKAQQSCVRQLNDRFVQAANAKASQVRSCFDKGARGKLPAPATVDLCVDDDPKGAFAKRRAKAEAIDTDVCSALSPDFGYAGADAGIDAALAADLALARDVFGDTLDSGVIPKATDKLAAACQKAVLQSLASCQKTRRNEFMRCKKLGLKDPAFSGTALAACLDADPNARVAKACDPTTGRIATRAIANSCSKKMVVLPTAFPGCNPADAAALASCLDTAGCIRTCELFDAADALDANCPDICVH
jgi:glucose/arabinose dehydrogenase